MTSRRQAVRAPLVAIGILCLLLPVAFAKFNPGPEREPWPGFESFEGERVPAKWRALAGSTLSLSRDCRMVGKQSLLWQWSQAKARIEVHEPLFRDVIAPGRRRVGSGFVFWLYNLKPSKGKLRIYYGKRDKMDRSFVVDLNFKGWRSVYLLWTRHLGVNAGEVDTLILEAPENSNPGSLFVDCFLPKYEGLPPVPDNVTPGLIPVTMSHWTGFLYFDRLEDPYGDVQSVPPKALEDMRRLVAKHLLVIDDKKNATQPLSDEALTRIEQEVAEKFALARRGDIVNGKWVLVQVNYMRLPPAEVVGLRQFLGYTLSLVRLYRKTAQSPNRDKLLQIIFDLLDHLRDCGYAYGSRGGTLRIDHLGYETRAWPALLAGMRPELARTGRYAEQVAAMNWFAGLGRIKGRGGCDCDTLNTQSDSLFRGTLMEPDDLRRYRLLENFRDWLSHGVFYRFKPDGSSFHHQMHFPAYSYAAVARAAMLTRALSGTAFRLSAAAHERIKRSVYASAFTYFGSTTIANIRGRTSIYHGYTLPDGQGGMLGAIKDMAFAGTPDGAKAIDPEMAGLFLALAPPEADEAKELAAKGFRPKPFPQHDTLNGASAALHRKSRDWMVSISGMKAPGKGIEIYPYQRNSYSTYVRCGGIAALTRNNDPRGGYLTGQQHDGWDWFHIPGSTAVIHDPQDLYFDYAAHRNAGRFAGGTHLGDNGIWGMNFETRGQRWRKSAFFFGDRIVLLGSGIRNKQQGRTVTTLFQDVLPTEDTPTVIDGQEVSGLGVKQELKPEAPVWVLNNRRIGFYLPAGHAPFTFTRSRQTWTYLYSRYLKDPKAHPEYNRSLRTATVRKNKAKLVKLYKPTFGNFAKGWLDHGVSPDGARYHFVMLMDADRKKMAAFAREMSSPQTAPYRILRQDDAAHILYDKRRGVFGFVFFEPLESAPFVDSPILAVNKPCFVMTRTRGDALELSVSDPAHQQIDWATPTTIRLTLAGAWRLAKGAFTPQPIVQKDRETLSSASATIAENITTLTINGEANAVYALALKRGGRGVGN